MGNTVFEEEATVSLLGLLGYFGVLETVPSF